MKKYSLIDTPAGPKTLVYKNNIEIKLHSAYNPINESKRAVNSFKTGRSNLIIVCGLGLGYHVSILKKKFPDHLIIIIEKDLEVIEITEKTNPGSIKQISIISNCNELSSIFEEIDISSIRGVCAYIHRPSYTIYKDFYDLFLKDIKEYISSKVSDLLTRFEFEENWIKHILYNCYNIYTATPVSSLFGKFNGIPGVIVSAGPSLRKNILQLKKIKDKALIVCVDTALKALQKYNIEPHIVMTLDSQKYSLKHFQGSRDNNTVLLSDIVSYPRVMELYKGKKIISTTSKYYTDTKGNFKRETTPLWDWVEQFTGQIGDIQSGGSVATSVFDLLLNLGCKSIILVGQDLAYTGRQIHCTGTYHNDEWLPKTTRFLNLETINQKVIRKRKTKYVAAYNGNGKVISDFVFDIYRYWFKDSCARVNIPVMNATEGGARIENTEEITLNELASNLKKPKKCPAHILESAMFDNIKTSPENLHRAIENSIIEITKLKTLSESIINSEELSDKKIINQINKNDLHKLITPFLRKTLVYLDRHADLPAKKASELLISDVISASRKIIEMLEIGKQNLEKIR